MVELKHFIMKKAISGVTPQGPLTITGFAHKI